jgi:hypothetical protein
MITMLEHPHLQPRACDGSWVMAPDSITNDGPGSTTATEHR